MNLIFLATIQFKNNKTVKFATYLLFTLLSFILVVVLLNFLDNKMRSYVKNISVTTKNITWLLSILGSLPYCLCT